MFEKDKTVCVCNDLSIEEVAECIKAHGFKTLDELIANDECPVGDKCEACIEDGFDNDGCSLAMVLSLVKQGRL